MVIKLTQVQLEYLTSALAIPANLKHYIEDRSILARNLSLPATIAEEFKDLLTRRLAERGFDSHYEPTSEGIMIESLIDAFSVDSSDSFKALP